MSSQVKKVLLQGIWGSLTGGWYYDPQHSEFANVFHLYTWLILMILPFMFYMGQIAVSNWAVICGYAITVFFIFAFMKFINFKLHSTFDKGEIVKREVFPIPEDANQIAAFEPLSIGYNHDKDMVNEVVPDGLAITKIFETTGDREIHENGGDDDINRKVCDAFCDERDSDMATGYTEAEVNGPPVSLFQAETHNECQKMTGTPEQCRMKPCKMPEPKEEPVSFDEITKMRKKETIGRCISLPSASSDSDDDSDSHSSSNYDENTSESSDAPPVKAPKKPRRRLAIRGAHHLAWFSGLNGTAVENHACANSPTSSAIKELDKHQDLMKKKSSRSSAPEDELDHGSKSKSHEKDRYLTSDQELIARDPVWQAERSLRSPPRRYLFWRRSYTVNSLSQVMPERTTCRGLYTVPPYNRCRQRNHSLHKLLRLWNKDQHGPIHETVPFSPGEVSPGEIKLMNALEDDCNIHPSLGTVLTQSIPLKEISEQSKVSTTNTKVESSELHAKKKQQLHKKDQKKQSRKAKRVPAVSGLSATLGNTEIFDASAAYQYDKKNKNAKYSNAPNDSFSSDDSYVDMSDFVSQVIDSTATWQEANLPSGVTSDGNAVSKKCSDSTSGRCVLKKNASKNMDLLEVESKEFSLDAEVDSQLRLDASGSTKSIERLSRSTSQRQFSSRGRRMRHPAGRQSDVVNRSSTEDDAGTTTISTELPKLSTISMASRNLPLAVIEKLNKSERESKVHIAKVHDDTSEGAMHAFQDEHGNWLTYVFGETSGTAQMISNNNISQLNSFRNGSRHRNNPSIPEANSDETRSPRETRQSTLRNHTQFSSLGRFNDPIPRRGVDLSTFLESDVSGSLTQMDWGDLDLFLDNHKPHPVTPPAPKVKLFYRFNLPLCTSFILQYDRLSALDLLDRNVHILENIFAVFIAIIVAVLGLILLLKGFFPGIWPLWFCVVVATAQYSLIRSVQPDSASPTHGHNRLIAYSRPIYFCMLALLILLFDYVGTGDVIVPNCYVYAGLHFTKYSCLVARNILLILILIIPIIFLLGLLPQIDTFAMYFVEQIEIHVFGGSASNHLLSAVFSVARSALVSLILFGLCYGGMTSSEGVQGIPFSVFCGLLISFSYHMSRQSNDPLHLWRIICKKVFSKNMKGNEEIDAEIAETESNILNPDELSSIYVHNVMSQRLHADVIVCPLVTILTFAIHKSTAFTAMQPALSYVLYGVGGIVGFIHHYLLPQMRKDLPWLLFSKPVLKSKEYSISEVTEEAEVTWFEKLSIWISFFERNIVYPLIVMNLLTTSACKVTELYGLIWGCVILTITGLKIMRSSYGVTLMQYIILIFSVLYGNFDTRGSEDPVVTTYFLVSILLVKFRDLVLKLQFIYVYVAPWQITWGSTFHAFAQPISVPHSGMLILNALISSVLHAPLAPFLGSAIFLMSYMRPIKFWEKSYNTKRTDHSNTRLSAQIDNGPSNDNNNLNSIFYEHMTLSLQKTLCGDISMGRWGNVYPGDCFIMTSDYLNALVHIIQKGNGVITFQLRGLEFAGTYCQQREVEAIVETENDGDCCCCSPGHPENLISFNMVFHRRWLAWQVHSTKFVLDGYSITDIAATSMLGVYDFRKILISFMVKSVLYFMLAHDSLMKWLENANIGSTIADCEMPNYVDVDPIFSVTTHEDYDMWLSGISRTKFQSVYGDWIRHCASNRKKPIDVDSKLVTLCFMVSVLCRRAIGAVPNNRASSHVLAESFLYGLNSLFKGDFRIISPKDEWIFNDMELMHGVVVPGVRMSVKLHQDHFQHLDEDANEDLDGLFVSMTESVEKMVITHEGDPEWRKAVLSNKEALLALRHVNGDAMDSYFVVTLRKRFQGFRIVRVNKECVKGLWAGQQQELIFLRNSNPERGSIQNAKQVLRNMINSSCDQPIGYPIYVSPVTTSFSNSHKPHQDIAGESVNLQVIKDYASRAWNYILRSCSGSCNSGGSAGLQVHDRRQANSEFNDALPSGVPNSTVQTVKRQHSSTCSQSSGGQISGTDQSEPMMMMRSESYPHETMSQVSRRCHRFDDLSVSCRDDDRDASIHGKDRRLESQVFISSRGSYFGQHLKKSSDDSGDGSGKHSGHLGPKPRSLPKTRTGQTESGTLAQAVEYAKIVDPSGVLGTMELHRRVDFLKWPNDEWRNRGGITKWGEWRPQKDMVGEVVFKWYPNHPDLKMRSHIGEVILLLKVQGSASSDDPFYVPIRAKFTALGSGVVTTQL